MDKVTIKDIQIFAYHGAFEDEITNGQNFHIDCTYSKDTSTIDDEILDTIVYEQVCKDINEFCTRNRFNLIETLANELAKNILQKYQQMKEVEIVIHKPNAPIKVPFSDVKINIVRGWHIAYLSINYNNKKYLDNVLEAINIDINSRLLKQSTTYTESNLSSDTSLNTAQNGVLKIKTCYTPQELLKFCQNIKNKDIDNTKQCITNPLNINILMYDNWVMFTDKLIIPYPEMHTKKCILEPLKEIEPHLIHPIKNKSVTELLDELK